jgi:hypothetical protein
MVRSWPASGKIQMIILNPAHIMPETFPAAFNTAAG